MFNLERTIRIKKFYPYPKELVWQALTNSKLLGTWFMENDLEPRLNHEFTFRMDPQKGWDGITYCQITRLEPMKQIAFTYQGEATAEKTLACAGIRTETADKAAKEIFTRLDTVLSFKLEPTCGGTLLYLEHSGFESLKLVLISFVFGMGWKKQLGKKLPLVLEKLAKKDESLTGHDFQSVGNK